ncbi:hypothetical protein A5481_06315 [Methylobacterium platani]|uniref:Recombinase RecT n=2 Tax=Methylobacterium platani TaxID=427683 RepID=A0A179SFF8_9HYPH|nr:hypothetical protein A5481_06315 [Methylobacterium platani]
MSTAVATTSGAHPAVAALGTGAVMAIVPQTFDEVFRFSQVLSRSGLCPHGMDTADKVTVAILTGLEIGVKPMQAVQGIAVIGGRPCIWGDLALGIVRGSGALEYIRESFEGDEGACDWTSAKPDGAMLAFKAVCRVKRVGQPEIVTEFSVGDAVVAKLWGKRGYNGKDTPWITNPKRMLKMRARGFGLRDGFADVLKGLYIAEELVGTEVDTPMDPAPALPPDVQPPDMRRAAAPALEHKPAKTPAASPAPEQPASPVSRAQAVDAEVPASASDNTAPGAPAGNEPVDAEVYDGERQLAEIGNQLASVRALAEVDEVEQGYADALEEMTRSDREKASYLFEQARERLTPAEPKAEPVKAEEASAGGADEEWPAYESRLRRLADGTTSPAQAEGLRKVWNAGKKYRTLMFQQEKVTREARLALGKYVEAAIHRGEDVAGGEEIAKGPAQAPAKPADPKPEEPATAPVEAPGVAGEPEAVRSTGAKIFEALSKVKFSEQAYLVWARSSDDRMKCGASQAVLDAWAKEYREIRKRLPSEED